MAKQISKIAREAADSLMAVFAGQTVDRDAVFAQINTVYAMAKKQTGFTSYFTVTDLAVARGASFHYEQPNYQGRCFYTFPAAA